MDPQLLEQVNVEHLLWLQTAWHVDRVSEWAALLQDIKGTLLAGHDLVDLSR